MRMRDKGRYGLRRDALVRRFLALLLSLTVLCPIPKTILANPHALAPSSGFNDPSEKFFDQTLDAYEASQGQERIHLAHALKTILEMAAAKGQPWKVSQRQFDRVVAAFRHLPFDWADLRAMLEEEMKQQGKVRDDTIIDQFATVVNQRLDMIEKEKDPLIVVLALSLKANSGLALKAEHVRTLCNACDLSTGANAPHVTIFRFVRDRLANLGRLSLPPAEFHDILHDLQRGEGRGQRRIQRLRAKVLGFATADDASFLKKLKRAFASADWMEEGRPYLAYALGVAAKANPALLTEMEETLAKDVGLFYMDISKDGEAQETSSPFTEGFLSQIRKAPVMKPPGEVPQILPVDLNKDAVKTKSVQDLLPGCMFLQTLGRTAIYRDKDGQYVALKFLNEAEDPALLDYEHRWFGYLHEHKNAMQLQGMYPEGLLFGGKRMIRMKTMDDQAASTIGARYSRTGQKLPLHRDPRDGAYICMAYRVKDFSYFRYLDDPTLSLQEFWQSSRICLNDLFRLARRGLIHTVPITLYHSRLWREEERRPDLGFFLPMPDIFRPPSYQGGVGDLEGWTKDVSNANPRASGMSDLAEMMPLDMLAKENSPYSAHLKSFYALHPDYAPEVFYLAHHLSTYFLSWALLTASTMRKRNLLDWQSPQKLAEILKKGFETAFAAFTGIEGSSFVSRTIDWEKFATQTAFYLAQNDSYGRYVLNNAIPEKVYGLPKEAVQVKQDPALAKNWVNEPGHRLGWYLDGENPDIGFYNGPFPPQEWVKAWNMYTAFMIGEAAAAKPAGIVLPNGQDTVEIAATLDAMVRAIESHPSSERFPVQELARLSEEMKIIFAQFSELGRRTNTTHDEIVRIQMDLALKRHALESMFHRYSTINLDSPRAVRDLLASARDLIQTLESLAYSDTRKEEVVPQDVAVFRLPGIKPFDERRSLSFDQQIRWAEEKGLAKPVPLEQMNEVLTRFEKIVLHSRNFQEFLMYALENLQRRFPEINEARRREGKPDLAMEDLKQVYYDAMDLFRSGKLELRKVPGSPLTPVGQKATGTNGKSKERFGFLATPQDAIQADTGETISKMPFLFRRLEHFYVDDAVYEAFAAANPSKTSIFFEGFFNILMKDPGIVRSLGIPPEKVNAFAYLMSEGAASHSAFFLEYDPYREKLMKSMRQIHRLGDAEGAMALRRSALLSQEFHTRVKVEENLREWALRKEFYSSEQLAGFLHYHEGLGATAWRVHAMEELLNRDEVDKVFDALITLFRKKKSENPLEIASDNALLQTLAMRLYYASLPLSAENRIFRKLAITLYDKLQWPDKPTAPKGPFHGVTKLLGKMVEEGVIQKSTVGKFVQSSEDTALAENLLEYLQTVYDWALPQEQPLRLANILGDELQMISRQSKPEKVSLKNLFYLRDLFEVEIVQGLRIVSGLISLPQPLGDQWGQTKEAWNRFRQALNPHTYVLTKDELKSPEEGTLAGLTLQERIFVNDFLEEAAALEKLLRGHELGPMDVQQGITENHLFGQAA